MSQRKEITNKKHVTPPMILAFVEHKLVEKPVRGITEMRTDQPRNKKKKIVKRQEAE